MNDHIRPTLTVLGVLLTLFVVGCGGSGPGEGSSTRSAAGTSVATATNPGPAPGAIAATGTPYAEHAPTADIALRSSAQLDPLPTRYTCDGANISPPVSWGPLPVGTVEAELFVVNFLPVHGRLPVAWAVAGLKPSLRGLTAGRLPPGAIVGRNRFGQSRYSFCPPSGSKKTYAILVYALPKRVPLKPGFDSNSAVNAASHTATSEGELLFRYKRV